MDEPLHETELQLDRFICQFEGEEKGPSVIFFGSIHGNEPSGYLALKKFSKEFENHRLDKQLKGSIIGLSGNIEGLKKNVRFENSDLNRIWTPEILSKTQKTNLENLAQEFREQKELFSLIENWTKKERQSFHFIDLHTTSGPTKPFVTINDTLANRNLAGYLPIPTVLGIEEYLEGTIMDFINDLGYPAIGVEAGQHNDPKSVDLHLASIWIVLEAIGCISKEDIPNYDYHYSNLKIAAGIEWDKIYEVTHREALQPTDLFEMNIGFENFQPIHLNEKIASKNGMEISTTQSGRVFMPLYQKQGSEGFFIIQSIQPFWLRLSAILRKGKLESFLVSLPGIRRDRERKNVLVVNKTIARFFSTEFLHLLGYRRVQKKGKIVRFTKREVKPGNWPLYLS